MTNKQKILNFRLSDELIDLITNKYENNRDIFDSQTHLIRCAIIKFCKDK